MQGKFLFILEREFSSHCVPAAGRSEVIALYSPRSRLLDYFMFGLMTWAQNITLFGALKYVQAYIQSNKLQCNVFKHPILYSIYLLKHPQQTKPTVFVYFLIQQSLFLPHCHTTPYSTRAELVFLTSTLPTVDVVSL